MMVLDQISLSDFVQQEAREKCFEIEVKAFKQFEKEKKIIFQREKAIIKEEYENKIKRKEQEDRIKHSAIVNRCRLLKMQARNRSLMKVFSDVQYQVYKMIIEDPIFYKQLLHKLIVQGLIKLFEPKVRIRCLDRDFKLVKSIVEKAKLDFLKIVHDELDLDFSIEVIVDENRSITLRDLVDNSYLRVQDYSEEQGQNETEDDLKGFGGILLTSDDGLIICKSTLDVRTDACFQDSLPDIRRIMF